MRPLPKSMLVYTVQYYELNDIPSNSRYEGTSTYSNPITINNVLVNYSKALIKSNPGNQEVSTSGKMYLDKVNSNPFIELKVGSKIVNDDGESFFVKSFKIVKSFNTIHHYEVELS
jgi:hypothetical protein